MIQQEWFICLRRFSCKEMPRSFFCRTRLPDININVIQFSSMSAASCAFLILSWELGFIRFDILQVQCRSCSCSIACSNCLQLNFGSFSHWWNSHGGGQWFEFVRCMMCEAFDCSVVFGAEGCETCWNCVTFVRCVSCALRSMWRVLLLQVENETDKVQSVMEVPSQAY